MLRMTFFSIFTNWDSFFARSGPKAPADLWRKVWPVNAMVSIHHGFPAVIVRHTNVGLAKEAPTLGRGCRRRGVLNLRRLHTSQPCD